MAHCLEYSRLALPLSQRCCPSPPLLQHKLGGHFLYSTLLLLAHPSCVGFVVWYAPPTTVIHWNADHDGDDDDGGHAAAYLPHTQKHDCYSLESVGV